MGQGVSLIDRHCVRHTVTGVEHDSGGASRCIQGEHRLDCDIHGWDIEGFKHDLCHALTICLWVQRCLGEQDRVLLWGNTELIVEGVVPNLLHVVPIGHDAMFNGVLQSQHSTLALRLVTHIAVLLVHANHNPRHLWPSHNGWEHGTSSVVTCETSFAHTGTIVHHQCRDFLITVVRHDSFNIPTLTDLSPP